MTRTDAHAMPEELEGLLADCIERWEAGGQEAVDELLAAHPEHADRLRGLLHSLTGMGLVDGETKPRERIGGYRLLESLGEGGMGIVWLARQESVDRLVALKIVHPAFAASPTMAERFRREAQAVAKLRHPSIVTVYGTGEDDGLLYTAMEYVEGKGLDELLREAAAAGRKLDTGEVVGWLRDVARALTCAHEAGIVHRDVKPSNVRITPDGRAMLLDFGLARDVDVGGLTRTGSFQGSPHYSAPEQIEGGAVGPATDVYGLGITLYEAVTGTIPFGGRTTEQVFHGILTRTPKSPRRLNPEISRDLETIILAATRREATRRYAHAGELADDLDALLSFRPILARPPGALARATKWVRRNPALSAVAAAALALLVGGLWLQRRLAAADRRDEALTALEEARGLLEGYGRGEELVALEAAQADARFQLVRSPRSTEEWVTFDREEARLRELRAEQEALLADVLTRVDQAEKLDPDLAGMDGVRADVYLRRWRLARAANDETAMQFYRGRVDEHDPEGRHGGAFETTRRIAFDSQPEGAEVFLLRYVLLSDLVDGGEPRLVPVPFAGPPPPIAPGTFCLRVVGGSGDVQPTDLIHEIAGRPIEGVVLVSTAPAGGHVRRLDRLVRAGEREVLDLYDVDRIADGETPRAFVFERGGELFEVETTGLDALGVEVADPRGIAEAGDVEARVYRFGEVFATHLPTGLAVRTTAAPALVTPGCSIGRTPLPEQDLERGAWLAIFRLAGRETVRRSFEVSAVDTSVHARLHPEGTTPVGFAYVPCPLTSCADSFWMMDHEVTCEQYLAFLNDPETLARVDASPTPVLYPRIPANALQGGYWQRGADGRFVLGGDWRPDMPVLGVSWRDASAYVEWRNRRARASGEPWIFELPSGDEQVPSDKGIGYETKDIRPYMISDEFRPQWFKTCFARDTVCIEPVLRFPRDESPHGVFDVTGSASEWCRDEWGYGGFRVLTGGSWDQSFPEWFQIGFAHGDGEDATHFSYGFRLVARRAE